VAVSISFALTLFQPPPWVTLRTKIMGLTFGQTVQLLSKEVWWWLHRLDKCSCKQCTQPEVQKSYKKDGMSSHPGDCLCVQPEITGDFFVSKTQWKLFSKYIINLGLISLLKFISEQHSHYAGKKTPIKISNIQNLH